MSMRRIVVKLPLEELDRLYQRAAETGSSMSAICREAVVAKLNEEQREERK